MKSVKTKGIIHMSIPSTAPALPLPTGERKRLVQAEVNHDLFDAVHAEMVRRKPKIKIRQVLEWGMRAYLLRANPKAAEALGIKPEEVK
jgi:hypothetical protein